MDSVAHVCTGLSHLEVSVRGTSWSHWYISVADKTLISCQTGAGTSGRWRVSLGQDLASILSPLWWSYGCLLTHQSRHTHKNNTYICNWICYWLVKCWVNHLRIIVWWCSYNYRHAYLGCPCGSGRWTRRSICRRTRRTYERRLTHFPDFINGSRGRQRRCRRSPAQWKNTHTNTYNKTTQKMSVI